MSGGAGSDMFIWSLDHIYPQDSVVVAPAATEDLGGGTFENEDLAEYDFATGMASMFFDGSSVFTDATARSERPGGL